MKNTVVFSLLIIAFVASVSATINVLSTGGSTTNPCPRLGQQTTQTLQGKKYVGYPFAVTQAGMSVASVTLPVICGTSTANIAITAKIGTLSSSLTTTALTSATSTAYCSANIKTLTFTFTTSVTLSVGTNYAIYINKDTSSGLDFYGCTLPSVSGITATSSTAFTNDGATWTLAASFSLAAAITFNSPVCNTNCQTCSGGVCSACVAGAAFKTPNDAAQTCYAGDLRPVGTIFDGPTSSYIDCLGNQYATGSGCVDCTNIDGLCTKCYFLAPFVANTPGGGPKCTECSSKHLAIDGQSCDDTCAVGVSATSTGPCAALNLITETTGSGWDYLPAGCATYDANNKRTTLQPGCTVHMTATLDVNNPNFVSLFTRTTGAIEAFVCAVALSSAAQSHTGICSATYSLASGPSSTAQKIAIIDTQGQAPSTAHVYFHNPASAGGGKRSSSGGNTVTIGDPWLTQAASEARGALDPVFWGFNNQIFVFDGEVNKYFHLYSDKYVSANTYFDYSNPSTQYGTVMTSLSLNFVGVSITVTRAHTNVVVNGVNLTEAHPIKLDDHCVSVQYTHDGWRKGVMIATPEHVFTVRFRELKTVHINTTFIDVIVHLNHPSVDTSIYGGILGYSWTTSGAPVIDINNVVADTMFSESSPSNTYAHKPLRACSAPVEHDNILAAHKRSPSAVSAGAGDVPTWEA